MNYQQSYYFLFNTITNAINLLEVGENFSNEQLLGMELLKEAKAITEELHILIGKELK